MDAKHSSPCMRAACNGDQSVDWDNAECNRECDNDDYVIEGILHAGDSRNGLHIGAGSHRQMDRMGTSCFPQQARDFRALGRDPHFEHANKFMRCS